jgi:hypothetical protein
MDLQENPTNKVFTESITIHKTPKSRILTTKAASSQNERFEQRRKQAWVHEKHPKVLCEYFDPFIGKDKSNLVALIS